MTTTDDPTRQHRTALATTAVDADALHRLADDPLWRVRRAVANNPATPPDVLAQLALDAHIRVRMAVVAHPSCPAPVIDQLASDDRRRVRAFALRRPEVALASLVARATIDPVARDALDKRALDPALHEELLESLAPVARQVVATSATATDETLVRLARDDDFAIQLALCTRPRLPRRALVILSRSQQWRVRIALASRRDLPPRVSARLLRTDNQPIVERLADNARLGLLTLIRHVYFGRLTRKWVATVLAAGSRTPRVFVWLFAFSRHWQVRHALASRAHLPGFLRRKLSNDKWWSVRWALASQSDLRYQDQQRIMDAWAPQLALATNPTIAPELARQLVEDTSRGEFIAGRALANPAIGAEMLVQHARRLDRAPWILRNIARNPNCPTELRDEILTWLALGGSGDSDPSFDPVTCLSHPGSREQPVYSYYQELARTGHGASDAPLWAARLAGVRDRLNETERVTMYAYDESVDVRRGVLQATLPHRLWRSMAWDRDAYVRTTGARVWQQSHFPRLKELTSRKQWSQWFSARGNRYLLPLIVLALAGGVVAAVSSGRPPTFLIGATGVMVYRYWRRGKNG